jgi:autotransporter-associated beta strand protein
VTNLTIHATSVEVSNIVFEPGADPYSISVEVANILVTGTGIINNSDSIQTFVTPVTENNDGSIFFFNNATMGEMTSFIAEGGFFIFDDSSSAGSASFDISNAGIFPAEVGFNDTSTAAEATIRLINKGSATFGDAATAANAVITATTGGSVLFGIASSAGNAVVTLSGDSHASFTQSATVDHGHFTAEGAASTSEPGAEINLSDSTTAGEATFLLKGGSVTGANGASMTFFNEGSAGNAAITVKGGTNGGKGATVMFQGQSGGGTASLTLHGDGKVDFSKHQPGVVTVGSMEGDGQMVLGATALAVGGNNQSTTFSGVIEDGQKSGGSLSKVGSGTLTLRGASSYTGGTSVSEGSLSLDNRTGSGTGTGTVQVNAGTLGGKGTVAGATTVGSGSGPGAFLAPALGTNKPATLTIQSALTLNSDATYTCTLKAKKNKARTDQVIANGVTINSGAIIALSGQTQGQLRRGLTLTLISNTSANPISGAFSNLAEGAIVTINGNNFQASYSGGDGNDLTLSVVRQRAVLNRTGGYSRGGRARPLVRHPVG